MGLYTGSFTAKALSVDGTGGAGATPTAGEIVASAGITSGALIKGKHFIGTTAAPAFVTNNAGSGTGASATVVGTDASFILDILAAGSPSAGATLGTLTWSTAYTTLVPHLVLWPENANAAGIGLISCTTSTSTAVLLGNPSNALVAASHYRWHGVALGSGSPGT